MRDCFASGGCPPTGPSSRGRSASLVPWITQLRLGLKISQMGKMAPVILWTFNPTQGTSVPISGFLLSLQAKHNISRKFHKTNVAQQVAFISIIYALRMPCCPEFRATGAIWSKLQKKEIPGLDVHTWCCRFDFISIVTSFCCFDQVKAKLGVWVRIEIASIKIFFWTMGFSSTSPWLKLPWRVFSNRSQLWENEKMEKSSGLLFETNGLSDFI